MFFSVGSAAPTERRLRKEMGIPRHHRFLGWLVHTPDEDGFLERHVEQGSLVFRSFSGSPEHAAKFRLPAIAARIADELSYPAVLVAAFDVGDTIAVIPVGGNEFSAFNPKASE